VPPTIVGRAPLRGEERKIFERICAVRVDHLRNNRSLTPSSRRIRDRSGNPVKPRALPVIEQMVKQIKVR